MSVSAGVCVCLCCRLVRVALLNIDADLCLVFLVYRSLPSWYSQTTSTLNWPSFPKTIGEHKTFNIYSLMVDEFKYIDMKVKSGFLADASKLKLFRRYRDDLT